MDGPDTQPGGIIYSIHWLEPFGNSPGGLVPPQYICGQDKNVRFDVGMEKGRIS
jgi:hypothetical protein